MAGTDAYEDTVKKFGLDPEKEYKNKTGEIPIPIEWRPEIINHHITTKMTDIEYTNHDKVDRVFTIVFKDKESVKKHEEEFYMSLLKSMNEYIKNIKDENPKKYYRALILETAVDGISFTIKY